MQKNQKYATIKKKIGFTLIEALTILGIKRNTEGDSPKYLIDNKDKKNVILSRSEGFHNKKILRSLCSLRMTNTNSQTHKGDLEIISNNIYPYMPETSGKSILFKRCSIRLYHFRCCLNKIL